MPIDDSEYAAAGVPQEPTGPMDQPGDVERLNDRPSMGAPNGPGVQFFDEDRVMVDADPTVLALDRIGAALGEMAAAKKLPPQPMVLAQHRFRILCMDVLGHMYSEDDATRVADTMIMGVYGGHLGYKQLRAYVFDDQRNKLTTEQRWFALGLCAGFMVDYLPRVRG